MQANHSRWTNGDPVSLQNFDANKHGNKFWKDSWKLSMQYIKWYQGISGLMMHINHVNNSFKKVKNINKIIEAEKNQNGSYFCTLLLLWNKYYFHWIKVPCVEKILDKHSIYCSQKSQINRNFTKLMPKVRVLSFEKEMLLSNVYTCEVGNLISSVFVCDKQENCWGGDDESVCTKKIFGYEMWEIIKQTYLTSGEQTENSMLKVKQRTQLVAERKLSCFDSEIKCKYEIYNREHKKSLRYCADGYHLKNCKNVSCDQMYKCPGYYCVHLRHVCDGHWDCPSGSDEGGCNNKSNPGFYHCAESSIFLAVSSVCDSNLDCPKQEDETNCELNQILCPPSCFCVFFTVLCRKLTLEFPLKLDLQFTSIIIFNSTLQSITHILYSTTALRFLKLSSLPFSNICNIAMHFSSFTHLEESGNQIGTLQPYCIDASSLIFLNFTHNNLFDIECLAFDKCSLLSELYLKKNRLTELKSCSFNKLRLLTVFDISENNINVVDPIMFQNLEAQALKVNSPKSLLICCLKIAICLDFNKSKNPEVCSRMFGSEALLFVVWSLIFLAILVNGGLFYSSINKYLKVPHSKASVIRSYETLCFDSVVSLFMYCLTPISFALTDLHFGPSFYMVQFNWQHNPFCFLQFCLFIFSTSSIISSLSLLTLCRYSVVAFPIKSRFKEVNFILNKITWKYFSITIFSFGTSMSLFVSCDYRIPCNFCLPLGKIPLPCVAVGSVLISLFVFYCMMTVIINCKTIKTLTKEEEDFLSQKKQNQKSKQLAAIKFVKTTIFNLLVWIPISIIYLVVNLSMQPFVTVATILLAVFFIPFNNLLLVYHYF